MVLVKEYRIRMPLTVEDYKIAQLYMVARFSKEQSTKGEGIEIVKNEPYEDENGKGQFTHKIITLGSHLPNWAKSVIPGSMTQVEEKSWNAYPYVKSVFSCPFFGDRFSITSETRYFDDDGSSPNVHNLSEEALKERQVDFIDITEDIDPKYYKKEEDPKFFKSEKTGRGPLQKNWEKTAKPLMTIYKLQTVEFRVWGLQTKVEQWLQKSMVRDVLLLGHRQAFCWMDDWFGLDISDIRKIEQETKDLLDKIRAGEVESTEGSTKTPENSKESSKTAEQ
eukprot:TRINITY_DN5641_c0_g1_i2.p1 TRINITY_DN5641_c0_g1~~TRINITY_DN5641_c0_g1_i2.p1  ORF type:complete len:279 (+),score=55.65 TRINITY_DN5641_c0_g1_i2:316-1152(+)